MAIQIRRGASEDFDASKMVAGELGVATDGSHKMWATGQAGDSWELASKEDLDTEVEARETLAETVETQGESLEGKAEVDGMYNDLYAGGLTTDKKQTDRTPYLFRKTASELGSSRIGERCYETIIGASAGENQLVRNGDFSDGTTGWSGTATISASDNVLSVTQSESSQYVVQNFNVIANHKYFGTADVKATGGRITFNGVLPTITATGAWQTNQTITNASASDSEYLVVSNKDVTYPSTWQMRRVMRIDLTALLGSSIADYIYTLETATAGSGIAKLREWGFLRGYQAYNAGSIESVEVTGKKVVGLNQWNEEWELGVYASVDGQPVSTATNVRSKSTSYIPVIPNATYYFNTSGKLMEVYQYDADKNYISKSNVTNQTLTIDGNVRYIRFDMASAYGTTYHNDICINLSSDRNGEYEAYTSQTYALGSDKLRGIFKLDANNNLYADGDVKSADGTITRRYKKVTYDGSEAWVDYGSVSDNNLCFRIEPEGKVVGVQKSISDYGANINYAFAPDMPYKCYCDHGSFNMFYFRPPNDTITTLAAWKTYLASNPITVVYELATPTTEQGDPFTSPQVCYPDGTEEYVTGNGVPVGHETEYPYDLKGLVEGLIDVPDVPSTNGTYVLKATRSASGITYTWVADSAVSSLASPLMSASPQTTTDEPEEEEEGESR